MKPDTIRDYLQRAEMEEGQAEALSLIIGELATRGDMIRLEDRVAAFESTIHLRFRAFEEKMDLRFRTFEERVDLRFRASEERMDRKLASLQAELTWKVVGLVALIVSVGTALNLFIG